MKYRPEIDGLRAIAVVPVILFHADINGFSGGYVGVDVFFVLSGYLISGIILQDLQDGRFSLANFYERRARRILPALFLTLILCSIAAWFWFLPRDLKDFAQSLAASVLFVSNLLFLRESAYFDIDSELKPLLHTWSLSIEEQYYILFPLLFLLLFRRFRRLLLPAVLGILLIGFGWSVWQSLAAPQRAYFLLTTRGWELMAGVAAMLVLTRRDPGAAVRRRDDLLGAVGLALILGAVILFDAETLFPGPFAVVPVLGTVLVVLHVRTGTRVARLLALRPLVLVGLISYSAYLFHQPLLAFLRYISVDDPDLSLRLAIVAAVFPLAWLSWRYVERPFRAGRGLSPGIILRGAVVGMSGLALLGMIGHWRDGYMRFDLTPERTVLLRSLERSGVAECARIDRCLVPAPRPEDVLLIGDSNAFHFSGPLAETLSLQNRRLISLTRAGCFPSDRTARADRPDKVNAACRAYYQALFDYLRSDQPKPVTVLLSAAWAAYFYGSDYFADNPVQQTPVADARVALTGGGLDEGDDARRAGISEEISSLLTLLSQKFANVCVVGPMPMLTNDFRGGVPTLLAGIDGISKDDFLTETQELLSVFAPDVLPPHIRVLYPHRQICQSGRCDTQRDGHYIYSDIAHISDFGARTVFADLFDSDPECLSGQEELWRASQPQ